MAPAGGRAPLGARRGRRVSAGPAEGDGAMPGNGRCAMSPKMPQAAFGRAAWMGVLGSARLPSLSG